ncbi:hypothetical protein PSHT_09216 [Puccinia striiformis]|uniref:Uncharacterized protein n=1 Tax=Puccinia striiformis TaxID=27350 RepID=A0A2S4VIH9_9BASI|nr:hypothetical protein PSHT_09216 [Puccinia striiformis]
MIMTICRTSPLPAMPGVSRQLFMSRSHLLAARPAFSGLSRGYHGASIHQHQTTEFLKKLVEAKETKGYHFVKSQKGSKGKVTAGNGWSMIPVVFKMVID